MLPLGFAENSIQLVPDGTLLLHVLIILIMVYVLNATLFKPINQILEAREQRERDAAVAKLKEVEERLARLDTEVAEIQERSKREAADERERIARSTETEMAKLGEQAQRE